ncbi:MAG: hypothetical protein ACFCGT_01765 [Sandaracinaceae bacterium]
MSRLTWFFANADGFDVVGPILFPLLVGLLLYQSSYLFILLDTLLRWSRGNPRPRLARPVPAGATVPSLLRRRGELDGLIGAARSLAHNGYPGPLTIVLAVDGVDRAGDLYRELEAFVAGYEGPPGVRLLLTGTPTRSGKGVAIDAGVQRLAQMGRAGTIEMPELFFNVDADSEVEPGSLEIMAATLLRRAVLTGERARIVTSHVAVPPGTYWRGWRSLASVAGVLRLQVAREYMVSLGLGRVNQRLQPQTGASGALYCTWFAVVDAAPRYARFLQGLGLRAWVAWWLGVPPPSFSAQRDRLEPLPEGVAGMGDDTWITWLALACRWERDRLCFDLPRTPAHALLEFVRAYVVRPYRYDPRAKIWTSTPTSLRGLYRQRMRWNTSRIWTVQRWGWGLLFAWSVGIPAILDVGLIILIHVAILLGALLFPAAVQAAPSLPTLILVAAASLGVRSLSTGLAILVDGSARTSWRLLLALPLAGTYHFAFNILPTIHGFLLQVLGFGFNSGFSPERTLIQGGSSRIALAYRARRALTLAVRSVMFGDVPLGRFWLGWRETPWTPNGYEGWDEGRTVPVPLAPAGARAPATRTSAAPPA